MHEDYLCSGGNIFLIFRLLLDLCMIYCGKRPNGSGPRSKMRRYNCWCLRQKHIKLWDLSIRQTQSKSNGGLPELGFQFISGRRDQRGPFGPSDSIHVVSKMLQKR